MTPKRQHEIDRAKEIAQAAIDAGFRAFIAEQGNYGFYTDENGSRVVSFQVNGYFEESISGNYVTSDPKSTGTGWRIADSINTDLLSEYFRMSAPKWATSGATWRHATLTDNLKRYQEVTQ